MSVSELQAALRKNELNVQTIVDAYLMKVSSTRSARIFASRIRIYRPLTVQKDIMFDSVLILYILQLTTIKVQESPNSTMHVIKLISTPGTQ